MPKDVAGVMREYAVGDLHSGSSSGPVVKNRKQAVAIALSEQRQQQKVRRHPHDNLKGYLHPPKGGKRR
jgi:hypothetical protein